MSQESLERTPKKESAETNLKCMGHAFDLALLCIYRIILFGGSLF